MHVVRDVHDWPGRGGHVCVLVVGHIQKADLLCSLVALFVVDERMLDVRGQASRGTTSYLWGSGALHDHGTFRTLPSLLASLRPTSCSSSHPCCVALFDVIFVSLRGLTTAPQKETIDSSKKNYQCYKFVMGRLQVPGLTARPLFTLSQ
jgi:hypothetical protein